MSMKESKKGVIFKGKFCQVWGGLYLSTTDAFTRGTLSEISRTLKAGVHDAGVVVEYDDEQDD